MILLFIISSCDNQAVQPEQQTDEFVIPQYGDTPLPGLDYGLKGNNTSKKKDHKKPSKSTADLLKHYVAKHKKVSFAAVTGRWKPNKQKYKYKARPLTFPDSVLQQANGETIFYDYYQHREDQDKIQRKLAALILDSKGAVALMDEWMGMPATKDNKTGSTAQQMGKNGDDFSCTEIIQVTFTYLFPNGTYQERTEVYTRSCGSGGDNDTGGTGDDWPDDSGGDWGDPGGGYDGGGDTGGGSDGSGGTGDNGCDPSAINQPPECEDSSNEPPVIAPEGVPQDYYNTLNDTEKRLCYENKVRCFGVYNAQNFAREWAQDQEPTLNGHNDARDALRHAMWSAKMAYAYGKDYAKKWGDAHEVNSRYPNETKMDLHNNAIGRNIGDTAISNFHDFTVVEDNILNARDNGDLCLTLSECN